ncbi:NAD(P)/FAD-dependent oxidoreductase [Nocardioides sp. GY 10113]|uniref:phytoene desaturase family protein n=1 Tax=Nocardioides sp. GY 10113 TaxID=2569761 RepID=UPI0010A771A4|nr:NAD(P)/FAD-dependent oxidoreductase [Nocardioides sp. GY 10113]TIC88098.1 NAD(P)/FAD-dependent oxidoreductase [Nocardioides sp. GY 10113]
MTNAVVVGSGPNGLTAAIRLARAGVEVTVVEAETRPGGGTRSGELTVPGVLHDECAAFHPTGVASPYLAELDLARHGLRWRWPEIDLAHPLDDGRAGLLARDAAPDVAVTAASLGADADRWRRLVGPAARHFDDLAAEVLGPVLHVPRHPFTLASFGARALAPATWLARGFADEPARGLLTGIAAHAFGRLDIPLSGAAGMLLAAAAHAVGWPVAEGGSEAITRALLAELADHGGRVVTGHRVRSLAELGEHTGHAAAPDLVLLDTAPAGALEILGDRLPSRVRRSLARFRYGPAAFKVDLAVDGGVPWRNRKCRRAGTLHLGGTAAEIARVEAATARGEMPAAPFVLVGQQYLADPTRSNGSVHPVYAYAHVPHGYTGDATEAVLSQIERFAPGVRERIVAVAAKGPAALEAGNANYVGGDIGAGAATGLQVVLRPRATRTPYATGVPGVYLCSAATPPGAGVHGMAGYHAAGAALAGLARRP